MSMLRSQRRKAQTAARSYDAVVLGPVSAEKLRSLADQVASQEFLDAYTARKKLGTNPVVTSQ